MLQIFHGTSNKIGITSCAMLFRRYIFAILFLSRLCRRPCVIIGACYSMRRELAVLTSSRGGRDVMHGCRAN